MSKFDSSTRSQAQYQRLVKAFVMADPSLRFVLAVWSALGSWNRKQSWTHGDGSESDSTPLVFCAGEKAAGNVHRVSEENASAETEDG